LFIDAVRHAIEDTGKFRCIFWRYVSLSEIPEIIQHKGKEILEQYVLTLDKLYPMYEHFWNTWISSICTGIIYAIYYLLIDEYRLDNSAIKFFAIIIVIISFSCF